MTRSDPDALLASIKDNQRGTLTVFLGAAAGVGKTFAMLEAARERAAEGIDLVAGWVETHGRRETEALLQGLAIIPPLEIDYRGRILLEMDLDGILTRRPQLVLVDELAHTNVIGSRHPKRFQDVEEILASGIDVYTTLNIQHLESLNDIVARVTGVTVREKVPDRILEKAEIKLVDIPSDELIKRLKEGKVYVPDQAAEAMRKFFRPGNINALRELALRFTAQRVDRQLETYMRAHAIAGPWPVGERVMVCLSPSPFAAQLIRLGSRIATNMQSEWLAVYVETPRRLPVVEAEKERLAKNLRLAEELGAETMVITGVEIVEELIEVARRRNVTQIIIGRPLHSRVGEWLRGGSVVDKLVRRSEGISVHVISGIAQPDLPVKQISRPRSSVPVLEYAALIATVALLTLLVKQVESHLGSVNIGMIYLLPVLLSAAVRGTGMAVAASIMSIIAFDFFFIPPVYSVTVGDLRYLISFAIYLLAGFLTGTATGRVRQLILQARQRERRMIAIQSLAKDVAAAAELDDILKAVTHKVTESIEGEVVIYLPDKNNRLSLRASSDIHKSNEENDLAVATWVFDHGQPAGRGTDTLHGSDGLYLPLVAEKNTIGVLGVRLPVEELAILPEQRRMLESFASFAALGINRQQLSERSKDNPSKRA
ncbi:MAG: sensor histidine kinase KdpD [Firmicutes bacterium]|nr:sensor histidine kinase KdpD [Bacillota bacterium]